MPFLTPNQQRQSTEGKLQTTSSTQTCFRLSFSIVWSTLVISRSTRCMFWTSSSLECRIWFSRALSTGSVGEIASTCGLYAEEPVSWFCTFTDNKYNSLYSYVSWQHDIACICCWMTCYYPLCCCGTRQLPISINVLPTKPTAVNALQQHAAGDRWDRQTDRRTNTGPLHRPYHILFTQCQ